MPLHAHVDRYLEAHGKPLTPNNRSVVAEMLQHYPDEARGLENQAQFLDRRMRHLGHFGTAPN